MAEQKFDPNNEQKLYEHVKTVLPYFDSRIFHVPENYELLNNLIWRNHFDYRRNSIFGLARCYYSTKELHKMNIAQQLKKLKEKGISWDDMPDAYKYGTLIKKQVYDMEAVDNKGEKVIAKRHRYITKSFDIVFNEENQKLITEKYVPNN